MKRIIALMLVLVLLLSGCGAKTEPESTAPAAQPIQGVQETAAPATEGAPADAEPEAAPVSEAVTGNFNPLNGQALDEPYTGRIFANTISNIPDALPHVGVTQADILMEMFVNNSIIRCLALFSNIENVETIGATRSTRLMFNDIAQHYDAILSHANGSEVVLRDVKHRGIDNINLDQWTLNQEGISYREKEYDRPLDATLFGVGPKIKEYAASQGMAVTREPGKDYGLTFTANGTPAGGEDASKISITITYGGAKKETVMVYSQELGKYVFNQYGKQMNDLITGEPEAFTNVIVMFTKLRMDDELHMYQVADFVSGGSGYYACGGKLIPITWTCDGEDAPFRFQLQDGTPLNIGVGNTYIAIASPESPVVWGQG